MWSSLSMWEDADRAGGRRMRWRPCDRRAVGWHPRGARAEGTRVARSSGGSHGTPSIMSARVACIGSARFEGAHSAGLLAWLQRFSVVGYSADIWL